jgi:hypothetical protein
MKKLIRFLLSFLGVIILLVALMAAFKICPPEGPWPMPPWCSGSAIDWPLSQAPQEAALEEGPAPSEMSENERLARVAVGLVMDLTTVNTYFNDAASSIGEVKAWNGGWLLAADELCAGKAASPSQPARSLFQLSGGIPQGFLDPLPASGFIAAPDGACAVGASPSASFLNQAGELITPELLEAKGIQTISYQDLTGGQREGRALESTLSGLITPGDSALATADGWNQKVWDEIAKSQSAAQSLMDYHLWTVSSQIEAAVVDSMRARMQSMGLPSQVMNALDNSRTSGWFASPPAAQEDLLAAMEIEAVFSGKTEGTIYERREFSLPELGEMPQFGPMSGEGSVVYHDPDSGDYPFDLEIEWTEWDELGRVTAGQIVFDDTEHGVVIEMEIRSDGSRTAHLYRAGEMVGVVEVDTQGMVTYQDAAQ